MTPVFCLKNCWLLEVKAQSRGLQGAKATEKSLGIRQ